MPRLPIDYSKTVIYKIVCNDLSITECYVGHTTDFTRRKKCHKGRCNNEKGKYYNITVYKTTRDNGGWNNWTMVEIEKYPCKDANEARAKEREWFERMNSSLNMQYPQRTDKEYQKQYREDNKEERATKRKQTWVSTWVNKSIHFKSIFHKQYMERVMVEADSTTPITTIDDDVDTHLVRVYTISTG
jgi:hypothetical protein